MEVSDIPEYISLVQQAKDASPFPVYMGFECEWDPVYESWYRDFLIAETGAEFLVFGAHWVRDAGEHWFISELSDKRLLRRYVDLTVQGIRTGLYSFLAHPDLFLGGYISFDPEIQAACKDIIDAAKDMNLPLEINGLGLQRAQIMGHNGLRQPYPVREFWEMAADRGARIICNSDAHRAVDVIKSCRDAFEFASSLGITPEDSAKALGF